MVSSRAQSTLHGEAIRIRTAPPSSIHLHPMPTCDSREARDAAGQRSAEMAMCGVSLGVYGRGRYQAAKDPIDSAVLQEAGEND